MALLPFPLLPAVHAVHVAAVHAVHAMPGVRQVQQHRHLEAFLHVGHEALRLC